MYFILNYIFNISVLVEYSMLYCVFVSKNTTSFACNNFSQQNCSRILVVSVRRIRVDDGGWMPLHVSKNP